ncbi:MAG: hypothetical protein ABSA68_13430 [Xanthobacteraceae bacterium]|jgi:hypothetical protein
MWSFLAPALAVAGGTFLAASTNANAANTAVQGIQSATQQLQTTDNSIAQTGGVGPGATYLRQVLASPTNLTPEQQYQLQQNRISLANQIHGSDYAGSGRTAAALFKTTDDNFVNTALQANQGRADTAAKQLDATSTQAAESAAQAGATGATSEANIEANAGLATGKLYGQALGDVTSLVTRQSKLQSTN